MTESAGHVSSRAQAWLDGVTVDDEVFALRPDYMAYVTVAEGFTPGPSDAECDSLLKAAEQRARTALGETAPDQQPHIAQWREAYNSFGAKPKKYKPSVEALVRRIDAGLPRIDRITDAYNAVSIAHFLPIGGEDLDRYAGSARLIRCSGAETFETTASGEVVKETPPKGEVAWADDDGVTCRRWNWRQCTRTRITHETKNAMFILDGLGALGEAGLQSAQDELMAMLAKLHPGLVYSARMIKR